MTGKKNKINVSEIFRIGVCLKLKSFRENADQKEYEFPSSLTSTERAYVHRYCQNLGLKSKSRGESASRFLTVYKKEGSTIVQADAVFQMGRAARQSTMSLLTRFPITTRERQELLPPTERDRILGQDSGRATFRLSSGIPQVPALRGESGNPSLPIWGARDEIIQAISCNQVVLISGETGSGKTTQVPQFILDHCARTEQACRILCTEPRRIAAMTIAERVALERDDKVGQTVGFQIRLESRVSPKTLLTFCTTGVLLRTLMNGDTSLATVTHVIVDEVHERDRYGDFLLIVLRDLLAKFKGLRLILMSAALDVNLFEKYFAGCTKIDVPGRAYEVKAFFLEDVLKGTGYTNKLMLKYKAEAEKKSRQKNNLEKWCNKDPLLSHEAASGDEAMDQAIEEAWVHNRFSGMLQLILSEKVSVDYQHSETSVSALMVAAGRGELDVVEQLLAFGASLHLRASNDYNAIDWAKDGGHKDVEELLCGHWSAHGALDSPAEAPLTEEDKLLLDAYHYATNEERIDHDLVLCLLQRICASQEEGAVLIFLSGYDDIVTLRDDILNSLPENRILLLTLHSQIQSADQKKVFKPAPDGLRKIILSTNIAETSVTINDVVFVIDCGKVKERTYDALTGVTMLKAGWISKASAKQRRGRAGRCRPGLCYHLFSRARFASFQSNQVPEILRVPIHELCLQSKLLAPPNAPIADFLAKAPDPPPFMVTRNAVTLLKTIDALDPWEELTELGFHLLDMPLEPRLGKVVLYAVVLKCLDPVLTIVCCLAYRDPFLLPSQPQLKKQVLALKKKLAEDTFSDHVALLKIFQAWQKAKVEGHEQSFCRKNFVSSATMEIIYGMRSQLLGQLRASGFVRARGNGDIRELNSNSEQWPVVKAALCAGAYPNLIRIDRERKQLITQKESKVRFHQASVLNRLPTTSNQTVAAVHGKIVSELPCDWLIYEEMMRTGSVAHAHCCTLVSPITVTLFAGPARLPLDALHEPDQVRLEGYMEEEDSEDDKEYDSHQAMFKIDDWISFRVDADIARAVLQLRQKWHALFLRRMHNPSKQWTQQDEAVLKAVLCVLLAEEQGLGLRQPQGIGQRPKLMQMDPVYPKPFYAPCNIRYFIVKANTSRVVEVSMASNIWAFTSATERKLVSAVKEGKDVILIFSIQGSGHFQGFARFTPHLADQTPPEFGAANLGPCYQIDWLKKAIVPFQSTRHLQNAWNENRRVQISRDGQELEPGVGESLCELIAKGQPAFQRRHWEHKWYDTNKYVWNN